MSDSIKLICNTCNLNYELDRTEEIPEHVTIMRCNWCPMCEEKAQDYYHEYWDEEENKSENIPIPVGPNQLQIFEEKFHLEKIRCPECNCEQTAKVIHTVPWHSKVHECECGYIIMESDWNQL